MKTIASLAITIIFFCNVFIVFPTKVSALGGYLTGDYGQVAPVEMRAIIDFDGKTETITASQTFSFNPLTVDNFFWVMVFPDKVDIKIPKTKKDLQSNSFLDLDKKTEKKFFKDNIFQKLLYPDIVEEKFKPSEVFSREAWVKYAVEAPKFKDMDELEDWFRTNAYPIPKNSREIFAKYLRIGWNFVVIAVDGLHLETDAKESLTINGAHTVPIELKLNTKKIVFPLELVKIQPDRDSVDTPLSFEYGSSSSDILGIEDVRVDSLLSSPSSNLYPPLLLDLMTIKIDLFVRADYKTQAEGFTTVYANREGKKFLTRLISYKPLTQLENVAIEKTRDNIRVNPHVSIYETVVRIIVLTGLIFLVVQLLRDR